MEEEEEEDCTEEEEEEVLLQVDLALQEEEEVEPWKTWKIIESLLGLSLNLSADVVGAFDLSASLLPGFHHLQLWRRRRWRRRFLHRILSWSGRRRRHQTR